MMKLNQICSLTLVAAAASAQAATIDLIPTWNLLGYSDAADVVVADSFGDANNVTSVWSWNTATARWAFYSPAFADGGLIYSGAKGYDFLTTLKSGNGFWVNSKASFTAELPLPPVVNAVALAGITATATTFQSLFATSMPLETNPTLVGLVDANMLMSGGNKAAFLHAMVTGDGPPVGFHFVNIQLVRPLDAGAVANDASHQWFTFGVSPGGGPENAWLAIKNGSGNWLLAGDQRQFDFKVSTQAVKHLQNNTLVNYSNEINTDVDTNRLSQLGVSVVVLTGVGVTPASGVVIYSSTQGSQNIGPCSGNMMTNCLDASSVGAGARYTIKTYTFAGGASVPAYTYTDALAVAPLSPAALAAAPFPTITYVTPTSSWASGGSVTVNWTLPNGTQSNWINLGAGGQSGSPIGTPGLNLSPTSISATVPLPIFSGTITNSNVWLGIKDASGNRLALDYEM